MQLKGLARQQRSSCRLRRHSHIRQHSRASLCRCHQHSSASPHRFHQRSRGTLTRKDFGARSYHRAPQARVSASASASAQHAFQALATLSLHCITQSLMSCAQVQLETLASRQRSSCPSRRPERLLRRPCLSRRFRCTYSGSCRVSTYRSSRAETPPLSRRHVVRFASTLYCPTGPYRMVCQLSQSVHHMPLTLSRTRTGTCGCKSSRGAPWSCVARDDGRRRWSAARASLIRPEAARCAAVRCHLAKPLGRRRRQDERQRTGTTQPQQQPAGSLGPEKPLTYWLPVLRPPSRNS